MRIDLFLKLIGVAKTRMAAKRLCDLEKVLVGAKPVKPSHETAVGEILEIVLPKKKIQIKVQQIPAGKSVSRQDRPLYFEQISSEDW